MQKEITHSINKNKCSSLYDDITKLENTENLIILDFYHLDLDIDNNSQNEEMFFSKQIENLKEISPIDTKINYLLFCKAWMTERLFTNPKEPILNTKLNSQTDYLIKSENIFIEEKITNIHFIIGFSLAKNITIFIFTNNLSLSSNWIKIVNLSYQNKLKFSEFEFMRITLSYMLKDKKKKYEEIHGKQPSKLSGLFDDKLQNNKHKNSYKTENIKIIPLSHQDLDIKFSINFQSLFKNVTNYLVNSPPKNFQTIKNILNNFSDQNIQNFKSFSFTSHKLSFLILSELIYSNIIKNKILGELIKEEKITSLYEIEEMINFKINLDNFDIVNKIPLDTNVNDKKKRKREKNSTVEFSISETSEEEYKKLIFDCPAICIYNKKIIFKILSNVSFDTINKLPTNPSKYKNLIYSYVNNQELLKITKKILNLDYEKIVNILTEGIIIEFMKNNLIVILTDKKIYYNINQIEKEKFRLMPQSSETK